VLGTGYGQTDPPCQSGGLNLPSPYAVPLSPGTSALIISVGPGGGPGLPTPVWYAGSAPALVCGVVQIKFQVPDNVAPGTYSFLPWIQLVDGNSTTGYDPQIGATIAVK